MLYLKIFHWWSNAFFTKDFYLILKNKIEWAKTITIYKKRKAVETGKGNITASIYHCPSVQEHLPPLERQLWTRSFCRGLSFGQKAAIKKFQKVSGNFQRGERQGDNSFINIFTLSARIIFKTEQITTFSCIGYVKVIQFIHSKTENLFIFF